MYKHMYIFEKDQKVNNIYNSTGIRINEHAINEGGATMVLCDRVSE